MKEIERLALGKRGPAFYQQSLQLAAESGRRKREVLQSLIAAENQVWEDSPQGLIRHMVNEWMDTAELCLDMYQQVIAAGGHSGKHRHLSEEMLFILEGSGFDLHWDPIFTAEEMYDWSWTEEPERFEWKAGDFVRVPPYSIHQHFADPSSRVRFVSATSRIVKAMGFDGLEQLEPASSAKDIVL
jgi:gentisate 1,2-dioxygenase